MTENGASMLLRRADGQGKDPEAGGTTSGNAADAGKAIGAGSPPWAPLRAPHAAAGAARQLLLIRYGRTDHLDGRCLLFNVDVNVTIRI